MYRKLKNENADEPNATARTVNPAWRSIREHSIADFVNRMTVIISGERTAMRQDRELRAKLYDMVFSNGRTFHWRGVDYDERMVLGQWRNSFRHDAEPDLHEPFATRKDWDEFCELLRMVRDPDVPMLNRPSLLSIGEAIERRQLEHARRAGWTV